MSWMCGPEYHWLNVSRVMSGCVGLERTIKRPAGAVCARARLKVPRRLRRAEACMVRRLTSGCKQLL